MINSIYISGPITGYDIHERVSVFEVAAKKAAKESGRPYINPLGIGYGENESYTHEDYMREDIEQLVKYCDSIYLMKGWEKSEGCKIEYEVAKACGMKIFKE